MPAFGAVVLRTSLFLWPSSTVAFCLVSELINKDRLGSFLDRCAVGQKIWDIYIHFFLASPHEAHNAGTQSSPINTTKVWSLSVHLWSGSSHRHTVAGTPALETRTLWEIAPGPKYSLWIFVGLGHWLHWDSSITALMEYLSLVSEHSVS